MICDRLAYTGAGPHLSLVVVAGLACLLVGAILLIATRARRRMIGAALLVVLAVSGAALISPAPPAGAAVAANCVGSSAAVDVIQTSTMEGLAPGVAPVAIAGLVINTGEVSIRVAEVEVSITSVSARPDAAAGSCDASDYRLIEPRMPVGRTVGARQSTPFSGARIGFNDKPRPQDACQRAVVHLLYTVSAEDR